MFLIILFGFLVFYLYLTKNYSYWKQRNVKHDEPVLLFGNNFQNYIGKVNWAEKSIEQYNKYSSEKVVGYYRGRKPELIIRDLDIIRQILNVDFDHFFYRGLGRDPEVEPMMLNLFHADGDIWKMLRQRLTGAFTSGKLKAMFPLIIHCANQLQKATEDIIATKQGEYNMRELIARFNTDVIGACGFGIDMDSINNENSLFRNLGKTMFAMRTKFVILFILKDLFPEITKQINPTDKEIDRTIMEILKHVRKQRDYKPSGRNDFVDLLLEIQEKGTIAVESIEKRNPDGSPVMVEMEMDLKMMAAQLFIFFGAGFETSSSATSFTLHQLACHPDIQRKVHEEIDQVLAKYDNKLCYDAINEMDLLERSFKEALRIFPSPGILNRVCSKKYTIPDLDITIDPGVRILIPIMAIQNDEKYFESPQQFNPDRFLENNSKSLHKYVYMPFGEGPRSCIGKLSITNYIDKINRNKSTK